MKKRILIGGLGLSLIMAACNSTSTESTSMDSMSNADSVNMSDDTTSLFKSKDDNVEFAQEVATGGMMEVELGKLAEKNAGSQAVKNFGKMMVDDHTKACDEMKTLAANKNITLPADLTDDQRKDVEDLSKKTGADFDKDYMKLMVDDHKDDVDAFEDYSKKDDADADMKAFAAKTLPTLQKHLDAAKTIKDKL